MPQKKIIAVMGATGAQGGGLVRAILADPDHEFAARTWSPSWAAPIANRRKRNWDR